MENFNDILNLLAVKRLKSGILCNCQIYYNIEYR